MYTFASDCNSQQHEAALRKLEQGPGLHRLWWGRWAPQGAQAGDADW